MKYAIKLPICYKGNFNKIVKYEICNTLIN